LKITKGEEYNKNMANADFLRNRAQGFYENALENLEKGRYFLAAFNFEQALQLYLKYYIYLKIADFPKIHSIRELLLDVAKVYSKEKEIAAILEREFQVISDLEEAYISSRYLPSEFTSAQVKEMRRFVEQLIEFLKGL